MRYVVGVILVFETASFCWLVVSVVEYESMELFGVCIFY